REAVTQLAWLRRGRAERKDAVHGTLCRLVQQVASGAAFHPAVFEQALGITREAEPHRALDVRLARCFGVVGPRELAAQLLRQPAHARLHRLLSLLSLGDCGG